MGIYRQRIGRLDELVILFNLIEHYYFYIRTSRVMNETTQYKTWFVIMDTLFLNNRDQMR